MNKIPRLLFAAAGSGTGKTTVTCAFLQALKGRGQLPAAFKCGPDYIDPMFHTKVVGVPSRNLDLFFTSERQVRGLLARHAAHRDIAVLEGVMGYYDGVGATDRASSWHLACATDTPVVLVLRPGGAALTLAAQVQGLCGFRGRHQVAGVLLNSCSSAQFDFYAPLLEREAGVPVLGYLPPMPQCAVESRHLGLVTAGEIADLQQKMQLLGEQMERTVDMERLLAAARSAPPIGEGLPPATAVTGEQPVIAVAQDAAFCFYYQDNLDLLGDLGAHLAYFSPLRDAALPEKASALYIGGGYPELYAQELGGNHAMRAAVRAAVGCGMPTLAECGGFQYLQRSLADQEGRPHQMVGAIASASAPAARHGRFGYIELTARQDTLLCRAGERIAAHEFHRWDSERTGDAFEARKASGTKGWHCIVAEGNLFAGYPHLYFYSNQSFAERFVLAAADFAAARGGAL